MTFSLSGGPWLSGVWDRHIQNHGATSPNTDVIRTGAGFANGATFPGEGFNFNGNDTATVSANQLIDINAVGSGTLTAQYASISSLETITLTLSLQDGSGNWHVFLSGLLKTRSALTGNLTVANPVALAGVMSSRSVLTGDLSITDNLQGKIACSSNWTGSLSVQNPLGGTISCSSSWTGDLTVSPVLMGSINSQSVLTGTLSVTGGAAGGLGGEIVSSSAMRGALTVLDQQFRSPNVIGTLEGTFPENSGDVSANSVTTHLAIPQNLMWKSAQLILEYQVTSPYNVPIGAAFVGVSDPLAGPNEGVNTITPSLNPLPVGSTSVTHTIQLSADWVARLNRLAGQNWPITISFGQLIPAPPTVTWSLQSVQLVPIPFDPGVLAKSWSASKHRDKTAFAWVGLDGPVYAAVSVNIGTSATLAWRATQQLAPYGEEVQTGVYPNGTLLALYTKSDVNDQNRIGALRITKQLGSAAWDAEQTLPSSTDSITGKPTGAPWQQWQDAYRRSQWVMGQERGTGLDYLATGQHSLLAIASLPTYQWTGRTWSGSVPSGTYTSGVLSLSWSATGGSVQNLYRFLDQTNAFNSYSQETGASHAAGAFTETIPLSPATMAKVNAAAGKTLQVLVGAAAATTGVSESNETITLTLQPGNVPVTLSFTSNQLCPPSNWTPQSGMDDGKTWVSSAFSSPDGSGDTPAADLLYGDGETIAGVKQSYAFGPAAPGIGRFLPVPEDILGFNYDGFTFDAGFDAYGFDSARPIYTLCSPIARMPDGALFQLLFSKYYVKTIQVSPTAWNWNNGGTQLQLTKALTATLPSDAHLAQASFYVWMDEAAEQTSPCTLIDPGRPGLIKFAAPKVRYPKSSFIYYTAYIRFPQGFTFGGCTGTRTTPSFVVPNGFSSLDFAPSPDIHFLLAGQGNLPYKLQPNETSGLTNQFWGQYLQGYHKIQLPQSVLQQIINGQAGAMIQMQPIYTNIPKINIPAAEVALYNIWDTIGGSNPVGLTIAQTGGTGVQASAGVFGNLGLTSMAASPDMVTWLSNAAGTTVNLTATLQAPAYAPTQDGTALSQSPLWNVNIRQVKMALLYGLPNGASADFRLIRSRNNGRTWEYAAGGAAVPFPTTVCRDWNRLQSVNMPLIPTLVADEGKVAVLWYEGGAIKTLTSSDRGETWA